MGNGKSIIINCFKVPLGNHNVTLSDNTKAKLEISGTSEQPKCSLSYRVKDAGGFDNYRLVDENCDGLMDLLAEKQSDKKVWTEDRGDRGHLPGNYYVLNPMIAEALGKLVPNFAFGSIARRYRDCQTGELQKLMPPASAEGIDDYYSSIHGLYSSSSFFAGKPAQEISTEIHFETGKANLSASAKQKLEQFARGYESGEIVIEGHCDPRGSNEYNFELGNERANAAAAYLEEEFRKLGRRMAAVSIISFGESMAAGKSYESARRSVITAGEIPLKRALDQVKGNPYLIDASGSMVGVWNMVSGYQFPEGTELYSFNSCVGVAKGLERWPNCHTPLWQSLYQLILDTNKGVTIVIITDGEDTEGFPEGVDLGKLITAAKKKNIKVSTVFVGAPLNETEKVMLKISVSTGGSFYLRTR
ncbi:MAG: OmpA family protein [Deltaproteobacteria bacterium]|nr:OmpA family protein [Deltaproteobacteria bacterium]